MACLPSPGEHPSLDLRQGLAVIEHQGIDMGLELMLRPDPGARPG